MHCIQRNLTLCCMMSLAMEMKSHSPHVLTALPAQTMMISLVIMLILFVRVRVDIKQQCNNSVYI